MRYFIYSGCHGNYTGVLIGEVPVDFALKVLYGLGLGQDFGKREIIQSETTRRRRSHRCQEKGGIDPESTTFLRSYMYTRRYAVFEREVNVKELGTKVL